MRIKLPDGVTIIGYADDLAVITIATEQYELENNITYSLEKIQNKLEEKRLTLAQSKTELVILVGPRDLKQISITVNEHQINSRVSAMNLGICLERSLHFREHLQRIIRKAGDTKSALSQFIAESLQSIVQSWETIVFVYESSIMYAAPVWVGILKYKNYRSKMESTQRKIPIRLSQAYLTASIETQQAITGVPPVDLTIIERSRTYGNTESKAAARRCTMIA